MAHVCTLYCTPPVHAHRLLRLAPEDEAAIRHEYTQLGCDVRTIKPVLEFDLATWRQYMSNSVCEEDGQVVYRPLGPAGSHPNATYAYLMWVRWPTPSEGR